MNKVEVLDKLIADERGSIRLSLIVALGVFVIGLAISTVIYFLASAPPENAGQAGKSPTEALSTYLLAIPPLVTTLLTGFPLKEYLAQRKRISYGQILQAAYQSPPVEEEVEKRFWTFMDKAAG